jgi:hypothetical protein
VINFTKTPFIQLILTKYTPAGQPFTDTETEFALLRPFFSIIVLPKLLIKAISSIICPEVLIVNLSETGFGNNEKFADPRLFTEVQTSTKSE